MYTNPKASGFVIVYKKPVSNYQTPYRVGMVLNGRIHLWCGPGQWHHVSFPAEGATIVRQATDRERVIGIRLEP